MRSGFALSRIVFLAIIAIVFFKFVIPKINAVKSDTLVMNSVAELETAMKDIKQYYHLRGEFASIDIMTFVRNFEDNYAKLEFDKPVKYGVLSSGKMYFCTELVAKIEDGTKVLILTPTSDKSVVCQEFISRADYQALKRYPL